jgi:hypothetical protein
MTSVTGRHSLAWKTFGTPSASPSNQYSPVKTSPSPLATAQPPSSSSRPEKSWVTLRSSSVYGEELSLWAVKKHKGNFYGDEYKKLRRKAIVPFL